MMMHFTDRDEAVVKPRVALISIVGFWLFYFAIVTVRAAVMGFDDQVDMLWRRTIVILVGMVITWGLYLCLRSFQTATLRTRIIAAAILSLPASILMSTANWAAFYAYNQRVMVEEKSKVIVTKDEGAKSVTIQVGGANDEHEDKSPVMLIADSAANNYFFMAAWAALFLALSYAAETRAAERRAATYRAAAQSAELRALRYQVNPHFLFNTLNSLSSLVLKGQTDQAEHMIMNLSNFFRTTLTADPTEDVMLAEEIRLQRLYLDIEAIRFPERLNVEVDVPASLLTACVPALILQPLVENAIKYGVSRSRRPVTIRIIAREEPRGISLTVSDDGDPVAGDEVHVGTGTGLRNVRDRLAARFGEAGGCRWAPMPGGGFAATLFLPLIRHG